MDPQHATILIIDDHAFIRQALTLQLAGLGCQRVLAVADAEEAQALFKQRQFDLLIVDLELEAVNGLELIKRIRSGTTKQPADSRILVLTSHSESLFIGTAVALDVNGFLVKGSDQQKLQRELTLAFKRPVTIRPAVGYAVINTGNALFQSPEKDDGEHHYKPGVSMDSGEGQVKRLFVEQLAPGMMLAESLFSKKGRLILAKKKILTQENITRIAELSDSLDKPYITIHVKEQS